MSCRPVTTFYRRVAARQAQSARTTTQKTNLSDQAPSASRSARCYSSRPVASQLSSNHTRRRTTINDVYKLHKNGTPITVLTAHDYASAINIENSPSPIEVCLIGDSLAMVACGYESTVQLPFEEFLFHCRAVNRGVKSSLVIADMPFGTFEPDTSEAVRNATRIMREGGGVDGVKLEGGSEIYDTVKKLTAFGIPVMGHVGLTPQRQASLGGYKVQGKSAASGLRIYRDALALQEAGVFSIVLEAVPSPLARFITDNLKIPTIGIGAGKHCSGQVLVQLDMLGGFDRFVPRFCKQYMDLSGMARGAIGQYAEDVRSGSFPEEGTHTYPIKEEEWKAFLEKAGERVEDT